MLLTFTSLPVESKAFNREELDYFEAKIRPVLSKNCYECHSTSAAAKNKLKANLFLDTRKGVLQGGDSGPALIPGNAEESRLIHALQHQDTLKMPKGKKKLEDELIADFVTWINMGAPDPRKGQATKSNTKIKNGRNHWAFQPLKKEKVPITKESNWPTTPVDQFIQAQLEKKGLKANATADPRTLIRRATYDLTGLPPSPQEVETFLTAWASNSTKAYHALVDRLLASRHYGERWARHWLDLVRFAESNGYAFDKDRPNAYHYRNFVIQALNKDMPYDQFVRMQIAGDLLINAKGSTGANPQNHIEQVAATGFLVAGPFTTQQTQKERERSRYEQLDDIVHTLGTSMLGLTIGCARCHDHKYDPVDTKDYYRLAANFAEVGFSDTGVKTDPKAFAEKKAKFDQAHQPLVDTLAQIEKEQLEGRLNQWWATRPKEQPDPVLATWRHIGPFAGESFDKAYDQVFEPEQEIDLTKTYEDGKLKWVEQASWEDGKVHNTLKGGNSANYLFREINAPVAGNIALSLGSDDAIKVWINGAEIVAKKIEGGAAPDQEKVNLPLKAGKNQLLMKIINGGGPSGFYFKSSDGAPPPDVAKLLDAESGQWSEAEKKKAVNWYKSIDEEWLKHNAKVVAHKKEEPKPELTMIYSAKVRGSTYGFGEDTYKVYELHRGSPDNKQALAKPGFLQVLLRENQPKQDEKAETEIKARVTLADQLTDPDQGSGHLLARVMVNRMWHYHFGRGIVTTPSDFGTRGAPPTHPALLDWLAHEFIQNGWRLKPIHRLLMTSSVYMQAGKISDSEQIKDPENLLWWRKTPLRLEAEIIRDALLAVTGTLDDTPAEKGSLDVKNKRRSIYLTVKRSKLVPMLQLFDAPDAMQGTGNREKSTVAPQALALMNSPFMQELSSTFAKRVRPDAKAPITDSIHSAYLTAFARPPNDAEQQSMVQFIEQQATKRNQATDQAFRDLCHVLLCANEFIYID